MTHSEFHDLVVALNARRESILQDKRKSYTIGSDDVLANFKRVGERVGLPPLEVALVYFLKHVDAITSALGHEKIETSEPIEERISDAINYLYLLYALDYERQQTT